MAQDPFFIGWESTPAVPIQQFVKRTTLGIIVFAAIVSLLTALNQRTVGKGIFDFGNVQAFSGILVKEPVPMLISRTPIEGEHTLYLVNPFKHGFPPDLAERFHLQDVEIRGTLIHNDDDAMIEVVDGGITSSKKAPHSVSPLAFSRGQSITVRGEIVDSKCHLGVMNPGRFKPHRACAIRCIAGGIPPILVAEATNGQLAHYLIVGADGQPANTTVLDYVGEPVELKGTLRQAGDLKVFYLDENGIARL